MKIFAFTDVHADMKTLRSIAKKAQEADFCICCGDFTNFSNEMEEVLTFFGTHIKKPIYVIHGNHEDYQSFLKIAKRHKNILPAHLKLIPLGDNYFIFGFGGGGFSFTESVLEKVHPLLKKQLPKNAKLILLTHAPPYNTELDFLDEERGHRGCNSSRKLIEDIQPILALSGHFHETFTVHDHLGKTFLLNPGDEGMLLEIIDEEIKIKK
ncbi:MAG: metallophosphoesterase [Nanoarchaeota archaeon]|nr:metallophosphoesterase [Nanoarchaeota archaeon]